MFLVVDGKYTRKVKIVVKNKITEQMPIFNYIGFNIRPNKYSDTNM